MAREIKQSVDELSVLEIAHISNMYLEQQRNELQQENRQLKEELQKANDTLDTHNELIRYQKSILDEIREYIEFAKTTIEYGRDCSDVGYNFLISADKIVEILDKAGKQ